MSRIAQIAPENADAPRAELFAAAKAKLGKVPNLLRAVGNSTAALQGYLDFSGALSHGKELTSKQREVIALAVGQANGCEYCLAAHSTIGKLVGLSPEEVVAARRGEGTNPANDAVARFAVEILRSRGRVSDEALEAFRAAGFGDGAVAEVVAHVALNVFTNYFNNLAETDVDFPAAAPLPAHESDVVACSTDAGCNV